MVIDNAIARVRAFMATTGWSRNRLAIEAGLAESTIRNIAEPNWNPTADTLRQLEAVVSRVEGDPDADATDDAEPARSAA